MFSGPSHAEEVSVGVPTAVVAASDDYDVRCMVQDLFMNDTMRVYEVDIANDDLDEIIEIVSEGMVVQWMKPYLHKQELLENILNTRDFTSYSPAELLMRVGNAYKDAKASYTQMIREYSYNHADLSELHL